MKEICHVCKKEKKPYTVILTNDIFSLMSYEMAREDGPICQRCDQYYAMTGDFKDATDAEFKVAKEAVKFANLVADLWKDDNVKSEWLGTEHIKHWYRKKVKK